MIVPHIPMCYEASAALVQASHTYMKGTEILLPCQLAEALLTCSSLPGQGLADSR